MSKNFKLNKIIKRLLGKEQNPNGSEAVNPRRDWKIILNVFIVAVIFIIAFSSYIYWKINSSIFFIVPKKEEELIETIDRSEMMKVIGFYETKGVLFSELKSKKTQVIDPSL